MAAWQGGRAVDARSTDAGATPLMVAAASGRAACCLALLAAGAHALAVNAAGAGVLSQARQSETISHIDVHIDISSMSDLPYRSPMSTSDRILSL
jgi:ankyrin repeat protein